MADSDINNIWRLHDLPTYITSYCGQQCPWKFLKELNQKLDIVTGILYTWLYANRYEEACGRIYSSK